jgi:hypothetical protein
LPVIPACCAALCDADRTEPPLQRSVQPVLIGPLESVCRPSDITVGPDQQRAALEVGDSTDHDVDTICPSACGFAHASAGQVEQHRAALVEYFGDATAVAEGEVGHEAAREPMTVTGVVADVGSSQQVRDVFGGTRLLQQLLEKLS